MSITDRRFSAVLRGGPLVLVLALAAMALGEFGIIRPHTIFGPRLPSISRAAPALPPLAHLQTYPATLRFVIDGDTFDARVELQPGAPVAVRIRLLRIDAPEMHARCAREWRGALAAKRLLQRLLGEGGLRVAPAGIDKYGRMLANASTRLTPDVSAAMLSSGLARPYDGGHRDGWCG